MTATLQETKELTLTIRVVFDGAAGSGKTTAAYALSDATGGVASTPDGQDGETAWFDWMTYSAGQFKGRSIRVELVTVPGAEHLVARRNHLLDWGDVVVFVADTNPDHFPATVVAFEHLLETLDPQLDVPIVVIANKRDLVDALPIDEVRTRLGLGGADLLVEGIATSGGGIQEAFILSVQAALEASTSRLEATTPEELLADMQAMFNAPGHDTDEIAELDDAAGELDVAGEEIAELDDAAGEVDVAGEEIAELDDADDAAGEVDVAGEEIAELDDADDAAAAVDVAGEEIAELDDADDAAGEVDVAGEEIAELDDADDAAAELDDAAAELDIADEEVDDADDAAAELDAADDDIAPGESHIVEQTEDSITDGFEHSLPASAEQDGLSEQSSAEFDIDSLDDDELRTPASGPVVTTGDLTNVDAPPSMIFDTKLNPDGIADGGAIVLLAEHWRLLVDIANGRTELSLSDSDEAAVALELATWGLIQGEHVTPDEDG